MIRAIAITGPTASGKTSLSIALAEAIGAEIISCDSMQIYREMNIGTAKATEEEQSRVKHHLIDFLSPLEAYSAENYKADAMACAADVFGRGKIPLFVGGTGLYIDTLIRDNSENPVPESDREYREEIEKTLKSKDDVHALWERLALVDPESAEKIHENNIRRVIRALEIYDKTGKPKSYFDRESQRKDGNLSVLMVTLDFHVRETLYGRINERVDEMIRDGLLSEVETLYKKGYLENDTTAAQAIGYKELLSYLLGKATLSEAVETLKRETRRYAKRQLTWFRHCDCVRVYMDDEDGAMRPFSEVLSEILGVVGQSGEFSHIREA